MEKKFITQEQKEKMSNRVVLNFGILLAGALVLLYVYNFYVSGYTLPLMKTLRGLGYIFAVLAAAMFGLSFMKKFSKMRNYAAIPFGGFIATIFLAFLPDFVTYSSPFMVQFNNITGRGYTFKMAMLIVIALMVIYFIALSVYTAIYLAKHPVAVQKKKIQHKKKK